MPGAAGLREHRRPTPTPDDLGSEMREVMWVSPDQSMAEGRWFWGEYQEFGFDVKLQRASADPTLIGVDRSLLKTGSQGTRVRLLAESLPAQVAPADLDFGTGVTVKRIVSHTPTEIVAEVDVAADAVSGKRDIAFRRSVLQSAIAVYDRIDYIKVTPDSASGPSGQRKASQRLPAVRGRRLSARRRRQVAHGRRCGTRAHRRELVGGRVLFDLWRRRQGVRRLSE